MKTKRILALILCTLMMFASFGMLSSAVETEPTAPNEIGVTAIYDAAFDTVNTYGASGSYIGFMSTAPSSMSFTLGVSQTGYYNIQTIMRNHAYKAEALKNDVYIATDGNDPVSCDPNGFSSDGSTYANPLKTVYLEKGDRVVTLYTTMTSDQDPADDYLRIRLYGIKLDLVEAVTDGDDTGSDDTETETTAPSEIGVTAIYDAAFDTENTYGASGSYIGFMSTAPSSMSFTLGVSQTGYYNIQTIMRNHAYKAEALKNDVYITTYRGDTVQCDPNGFSSDGSTYANPLKTVYLEKGDRVVTLYTTMTSDQDPADDYLRVRLYGIKLDFVEAGDPPVEEPEVPAGTVAIGDTTYDSLEAALNAAVVAGGDVTVTLLDNIELTEGVTVPADATITLDLNGKTVSMNVAADKASALITNNGTLTIKDSGEEGKLTYVSSTVSTGYSTSTIINNGTLTVESGTIENTCEKGGASYAIDSYNTLTVKGGTMTAKGIAVRQAQFGNCDNTVTVEGGTFSGGTAGLQAHIFSNAKKSITTIKNGTFKGTYAFYSYFYNVLDSSNTEITVEGGTFEGYLFLYNGNNGSSNLNVSITGGTFGEAYVYTKDADGNEVPVKAISGGTFAVAPSDYVADGYEIVQNEDGTYGAEETNPVDNTETEPTAGSMVTYAALTAQVTEYSNVQKNADSIIFLAGQAGTVKIKVGVPETGYYNVAPLMNPNVGAPYLDSDLTLTTDRGDSFTYTRTTRNTSWTYAPQNVYLVKGDRILTFTSNAVGSKHIVMTGVNLIRIKSSFYANKNLSFDIPYDAENIEVTAGQLFNLETGVPSVDSSKIVVTAEGATVTANAEDWTQTTIAFSEAGEYNVVINDDVYGVPVTATITVVKLDDGEREPTMNTVTTPLQYQDMINQATEMTNATQQGVEIFFMGTKDNTVKIKVGVPATGYYNVAAILRSNDGAAVLYNDLTLTTDRGDSFTYPRVTRGASWTYAPTNVYLVKGDRILTFHANMTSGAHTIMSGVRLYHMTKAFYALKDVALEIPGDAETLTVTADKLFATDIGVAVNSAEVEITAEGATVAIDPADWTKSTITFANEGQYTVNIKDAFYGGVTTATFLVTKELVIDDVEREPTMNTVTTPLQYQDMINQVTLMSNATQQGVELFFMGTKDNTVKIKVGVPETGYYNVAAILRSNDGAAVLYNDLTLTTDRGDSFTYPRATRGASWTYAPTNVYLVKGDRILTFKANMTSGAHTIMSGLRLYHITKAFYALKDLAYEIPAADENITVTADALFATDIGVAVNSAEVEITAPGATVAIDPADWTKSTIIFANEGKYSVSIKDAFYGGTTTVEIPVTKEKSEFKTIAIEGTTATVTYERVDEKVDKATLYIAEYADNGKKLVGINLLPIDTAEQEIGTTQTYSVGIEGATGALKAMLFDAAMAPVLNFAE